MILYVRLNRAELFVDEGKHMFIIAFWAIVIALGAFVLLGVALEAFNTATEEVGASAFGLYLLALILALGGCCFGAWSFMLFVHAYQLAS